MGESKGDMADLDPWDEALLGALQGDERAPLENLDALAASSGISRPLLEVLHREGLLISRTGGPEPLFDPGDAEAVKAGLALVEAGLPLGELLDLARRMDDAMRPVAARAVEVFARFVRDSVEATATSDTDAADRLVEAFSAMLPAAGRLVSHHFRDLLIADARRRLIEP